MINEALMKVKFYLIKDKTGADDNLILEILTKEPFKDTEEIIKEIQIKLSTK